MPIKLNIRGIKCDHCDYRNETVQFENEDYKKWLNKPCPKCGANLLTQRDLDNTKILIQTTKILNSILPQPNNADNTKKLILGVEMNGTGNMVFKQKNNKKE